MYIRCTSIKSKRSGDAYFTYRLVESERVGGKVKQRTLLNLGRHFDVPKPQWTDLAGRIEQLLNPAQGQLFVSRLSSELEVMAQRYAAHDNNKLKDDRSATSVS